MITGLRVLNSDSNSDVLTGHIKLDLQGFQFLRQETGDKLQLSNSILQRTIASEPAQGIYSINQIPAAYWNNDFLLLGSVCTSVSDFTDTSEIVSSSHTLSIFDGCYSCNQCSTLAQLQEDIQNLQIWINGFKDCNLYYQPAASRLWNAMLGKKIVQSQLCVLDETSLGNRTEDFGQGLKLLYQFKALVAMWNYLIRTQSVLAQIIQAPQDYGGFVVQTKRDLNACQVTQLSSTRLIIDIYLQQGQLPENLSAIDSGMGLFVDKVDQNTYIQFGRDTFEHLDPVPPSTGSIVLSKLIQVHDGQPHVHAQFVFTPSHACDTVLSGALKVLPVIYLKQHTYGQEEQTYTAPSDSLCQVSLTEWIAFRPYATNITQAQQQAKNTWYITVTWSNSSLGQHITEDYYYTTAYSKWPEASDSGSEPEQS